MGKPYYSGTFRVQRVIGQNRGNGRLAECTGAAISTQRALEDNEQRARLAAERGRPQENGFGENGEERNIKRPSAKDPLQWIYKSECGSTGPTEQNNSTIVGGRKHPSWEVLAVNPGL